MGYTGTYKVERLIEFSAYTSTSIWKLKQAIAKMLDLGPQHILLYTIERKDQKDEKEKFIKDYQHGFTLQQLKIKNGDTLVVKKASSKEEIKLKHVNYSNGDMNAEADPIIEDIFSMY